MLVFSRSKIIGIKVSTIINMRCFYTFCANILLARSGNILGAKSANLISAANLQPFAFWHSNTKLTTVAAVTQSGRYITLHRFGFQSWCKSHSRCKPHQSRKGHACTREKRGAKSENLQCKRVFNSRECHCKKCRPS